MKVQIKATTSPTTASGDWITCQFRGIRQYDDLRSEALSVPRILVVLFLPTDRVAWITHSDDALSLHKCAVVLALLPPDEGETVRARLNLDSEDYERAANAHMTNGRFVVVTGRLRPGKQPRPLVEVSHFGELLSSSAPGAAPVFKA